MKRTFFVLIILSLVMFAANLHGQLLEENFDYAAGDSLSDHGWDVIRGGGKIIVTSPGLRYDGYALSDIGNAVSLNPNGEELVRKFGAQRNGQIYASFMVNVRNAIVNSAPDLMLYLGGENTDIFTRAWSARVRKDDSDKVAFGIGKFGASKLTDYLYDLNTTYLIVMKYKFSDGVADTASIWVNPEVTGGEPEPDVSLASGTDAEQLSEIVLTQIDNDPELIIDGIRICKSWDLIQTSVADVNKTVPDRVKLYQNYPNPFNPMTNITYSLNSSADVQLDIFNVRGQHIESLQQKYQASGEYTVQWDAGKVPSGVYMIRLKSAQFLEVKKAILLR